MTAVDVRIYEVGPRDGLQAEAATPVHRRQAAAARDAGRCRPARDRGDLLRLTAGHPPAGRRRRAHGAASTGGPACATRCSCRTSAAWSAPSRPGSTPSASSPPPPSRTCATTSAWASTSRWPPSRPVAEAAPPRAGGCAPTSAPPSAARTRARWRRARWPTSAERLLALGVDELPISDTVGAAGPPTCVGCWTRWPRPASAPTTSPSTSTTRAARRWPT